MRSRWCGRILSDVIGRLPSGRTAVDAAVLEDEPRHQARHASRRVSSGSACHAGARRAPLAGGWAEQIELPGLTLRDPQDGGAGVAWASPRFWSQASLCCAREPEHSMMAARHDRAGQQAPKRRQRRQVHARAGCDPHRQAGQPGRTSRPAAPASALPIAFACSAEPSPAALLDHLMDIGRRSRPKDASDKEPRAPSAFPVLWAFRRRVVQRAPAAFSLRYLTPAAYAATLTTAGARRNNPNQLRRPPVAPPAPTRQSQPGNLASAG